MRIPALAPETRTRFEELRRGFAQCLKPHLARLLEAFGLDLYYHRGQGDYLYYDGADGEVEVLDMVGGFGASLMGHNHPELVELAQQLLREKRPFHAQASVRGLAGRLAERLSSAVQSSTGHSYVVTLGSTGAEAVEMAIKHAELELSRRHTDLLGRWDENGRVLRSQLRAGKARLSTDFLQLASQRLQVNVASFDDFLTEGRRQLQQLLEHPPAFLAFEGSFHGKSTGALKLTHREEFRLPWRRLGNETTFLPLEDRSALDAAIQGFRRLYFTAAVGMDENLELRQEAAYNLAAIFAEPVQGEGGIHVLSTGFLQALREAADLAGCPLVFDEIQSGMGRCGRFLASDVCGVRADYYLFSKTLGGGLAKISALLVDRECYETDFSYLHTSTFADDDFSSLIALRTLDLLEMNQGELMRQCQEKGEFLAGRLRQIARRFPAQIREVRGLGLMIGVELRPQSASASPLLRELSEQGLLSYVACGYLLRQHRVRVAPTLSMSAVLRVEPSAFIGMDAMEQFVSAIERLCAILEHGEIEELVAYLADRRPVQIAPVASSSRPVKQFDEAQFISHVGFLLHFPEAGDLRKWEPRLGAFSEADCVRILARTQGLLRPFVLDSTEIQSQRGARVRITAIGIPFTADQAIQSMRAGDDWTLELVRNGVQLAREQGCTVVGLGGYTSIVSDNCREIVADDLTLTSGNSLTVAAAWEGCRIAARRLGLDLAASRMAVVGAAGNVGAVLAEIAADEVSEIVLIGRSGAERFLAPVAQAIYQRALLRLQRGIATGVAAKIAHTITVRNMLAASSHQKISGAAVYHGLAEELGGQTPVRLATDFASLRDCHIIVSCTSSPTPIILPEHVGHHHTVVCDVAVPRDVHPLVEVERPNSLVIRGGRIWAPLGQTLDIRTMETESSELYGCLAEAILLGFAGRECPTSYGKLSPFRVRRVRELAGLHGFTVDEKALIRTRN